MHKKLKTIKKYLKNIKIRNYKNNLKQLKNYKILKNYQTKYKKQS